MDLIVDTQERVWLIEINSANLDYLTGVDANIKTRVVGDLLDLVGPCDFNKKNLVEVLERRLHE